VFGFTPSLPLDVAFGVPSHAVEDLFSARRQAHAQVEMLLERSSESMKRAADAHRRPAEWAVGDSVLLST
jgi:glyoxylate carboligase